MSELSQPIKCVRDAVCATMRIWKAKDQSGLKPGQVRWNHSIVGTAWCIVGNLYLVTAFHTLNDGKARQRKDKYFVFAVPENGPIAYHTPAVGFPVERPDVDITIIEISPSADFQADIPGLNVTFERPEDGEKVLTYGFPAPRIERASLNSEGDWCGGDLFLKANANEGIVAGQYEIDSSIIYELNVGWHHGESGGPIVRLDSCAVFSLMQSYRNVSTRLGTVAGPHQGYGLEAIDAELRELGATIV